VGLALTRLPLPNPTITFLYQAVDHSVDHMLLANLGLTFGAGEDDHRSITNTLIVPTPSSRGSSALPTMVPGSGDSVRMA
jgi:hypothetical protein